MGKQSKRRAGTAPGQRGQRQADGRRTTPAKRPCPEILLEKDPSGEERGANILLEKDAGSKRGANGDGLKTKQYVPTPDSLQANVLSARLPAVKTLLEAQLLAPARIGIRESHGHLYTTLERVAQVGEAYRHADKQRQSSIATAVGIQQSGRPESIERAIINAIFKLPDREFVGKKGYRNALNRRSAYAAALDGLMQSGVMADDTAEAIRTRKGRIAAWAEVSYASRRDGRDRKREEEQEPPSHRVMPDGRHPGANDQEHAEHQADVEAEGSDDPVDEDGAGAVSPEGERAGPALLKLVIPRRHGVDFDDARRVLCVLTARGDKATVRAAVQLTSKSGAAIRLQVEQIVDQLAAAKAKRRQAARRRKAAATKPNAKRPGGHRGGR